MVHAINNASFVSRLVNCHCYSSGWFLPVWDGDAGARVCFERHVCLWHIFSFSLVYTWYYGLSKEPYQVGVYSDRLHAHLGRKNANTGIPLHKG
jgi:hypothetical protein